MQAASEVSILEAAEKYTAWCRCNTMPEHAAKMRLYWAEILRHKANMAVSAAQEGVDIDNSSSPDTV